MILRKNNITLKVSIILIISIFCSSISFVSFAANSEIYLQNDFEEGTAVGWDISTGGGVVADYADTENNVLSKIAQGQIISTAGFGNVIYESKARFDEALGDIRFRFCVNESESDYYQIALTGPQWPVIEITKTAGLSKIEGTPPATPYTPVPLGKWFDIKIAINNGEINVFVDSKLRAKYADKSPLASGKIGLGSESKQFSIDNVIVSKPIATPSPTPISGNSGVIYSNDFEEGTAKGFELGDNASVTADLTDIENNILISSGTGNIKTTADYGNIVYQSRMRIDEPLGEVKMLIHSNAGGTDFYQILISGAHWPVVEFSKAIGLTAIDGTKVINGYNPVPVGEWFDIKVSINNKDIKIYINSATVVSYKDNTPLPAGRIEFIGNGNQFAIDDITISTPKTTNIVTPKPSSVPGQYTTPNPSGNTVTTPLPKPTPTPYPTMPRMTVGPRQTPTPTPNRTPVPTPMSSVTINPVASNTSLNKGDTFTVSLNLSGVSPTYGIAAINLNLQFDSSKFEYAGETHLAGHSDETDWTIGFNGTNKVVVSFIDYESGGGNSIFNDCTLATVTFKVKESSTSGETTITTTKGSIMDKNNKIVAGTISPTTINFSIS